MADRHQVSSPGAGLVSALFFAAFATGFGIYTWSLLGWSFNLDINDPAFDMPLLLVLGAFGIALWQGGLAVRHGLRLRQTGVSRLELEKPGPVRLGQVLAGRVCSARPVPATGDFRLELTCYDVHELHDSDNQNRRRSFPVWSAETRADRATDATKGVPFRFVLPASVGPAPVPSGIVTGAGRQSLTTIHIPGFRRVVEATNRPPVDRFWVLKVTAPMPGPDFLAEFAIEVAQ